MHTWHVKGESRTEWIAWEEGNLLATIQCYRSWRDAYAYADINAHPMRVLQS